MFKIKCNIVNTKYSGGEMIEEKWYYCRKYELSHNDMDRIKDTLNSDEFTPLQWDNSAMSELKCSDHVAILLNNLVTQACDKVPPSVLISLGAPEAWEIARHIEINFEEIAVPGLKRKIINQPLNLSAKAKNVNCSISNISIQIFWNGHWGDGVRMRGSGG